ncbi:MAG: glutamine synthetase family protein [bacterium]|nr:glutamine synthetase family protein [bacterium]
MTKISKELTEKMKGITHFRLLFTDVVGNLKEMKITDDEIMEILEQGQGFDGSSVQGFARLEESDLMCIPRVKSFRVLPENLSTNGQKVGIFFCDIRTTNNRPFSGCPRQRLKKIRDQAIKLGFTFNVGPEMEFFIFPDKKTPRALDASGYFDSTAEGPGSKVVEDIVDTLKKIGIHVECSHHEVAHSQFEIDVKYQEVLTAADQVMLIRWVAKQIAQQHGLYITFMAKPVKGINGSGMHTHMSLFRENTNAFYDPNDEFNLSSIARHFCAGILNYVREFTAVTNSNVNSYKRLVEGYEAPVYLSWGRKNRSSLVRVPLYRAGKNKATRIELRSPDPCCNPYLAFAVMLSAGLEGMEKKMVLPAPMENNIFHMNKGQRDKLGIKSLPGSLEVAILIAKKSSFLKESLGPHIWRSLLNNLEQQWDKYRIHVTEFETNEIMPIV